MDYRHKGLDYGKFLGGLYGDGQFHHYLDGVSICGIHFKIKEKDFILMLKKSLSYAWLRAKDGNNKFKISNPFANKEFQLTQKGMNLVEAYNNEKVGYQWLYEEHKKQRFYERFKAGDKRVLDPKLEMRDI